MITIERIRPRTEELLSALSIEFNLNRKDARAAFQAVVHALRDRLTIDEAIEVLSLLPVHLKPLYTEGWKPFEEKVRTEDFLSIVHSNLCSYLGKMSERMNVVMLVRNIISRLENTLSVEKAAALRSYYHNSLTKIVNQL